MFEKLKDGANKLYICLTQESEDRRRRPGREARGSGVRVELAGIHPAAPRSRERSL
jgi:hypothetical protein